MNALRQICHRAWSKLMIFSWNIWPMNCLRDELFSVSSWWGSWWGTGAQTPASSWRDVSKVPHPSSKIQPEPFDKQDSLFFFLYTSDKPRAAAGTSGSGPGDETGGGSEPRHHLLGGNQWDVAQWRGRGEHNRSEHSEHFLMIYL